MAKLGLLAVGPAQMGAVLDLLAYLQKLGTDAVRCFPDRPMESSLTREAKLRQLKLLSIAGRHNAPQIETLIAVPVLRLDIGNRAKSFVRGHFSIDGVASSTLIVYQDVVRSHQRSSGGKIA